MNIYIETLGCPKNFNDSEMLAGILKKHDNIIVEEPEKADVAVVNTCGFINDAKVESIDTILSMAKLKKSNKELILVVSGCLSQRYIEELYQEMPEVDILLGVNDYNSLPRLLDKLDRKRNKEKEECRIKLKNSLPDTFYDYRLRMSLENRYSRTVKIAEGCDNVCAYCVIPEIRGKFRSRKMEDIEKEAMKLAEEGCVELILIAQDVTNYGSDIYGKPMLPELLKRLSEIEEIHWIRLMYCYEDRVTDELIKVMKNEPKVCNYIDMPIQHISDNILENMRRRSTGDSIKKTIDKLRSGIPDIHIRTTFITGFPGETENDFDELYDFVSLMKLDRLGVFAYSKEENTPAGDMENQIEENVKAQRRDSIMRRQLEISLEYNLQKVGKTFEVLVEGVDEEGVYYGRTEYDAPAIDNSVIFTGNDLKPGDFVRVKIVDAYDYDLIGVME